MTGDERHCADCHQPLTSAEIWVCNECCCNYAIWRDPNAYMTGEPPQNSDSTDEAPT